MVQPFIGKWSASRDLVAKTQRETLDYQRVENRAVSLLDLTPTILDALDVTPLPSPITMQGRVFYLAL